MSVIVEFYGGEVVGAARAAHDRNAIKEAQGIPTKYRDPNQSTFSIHFFGIMGEIAVAKMLGVDINWEITLGGDGGVADVVYRGVNIQVKTNMGKNREIWLYFRELEDFKADIAVLTMPLDVDKMKVLGWITQNEFRMNYDTRKIGQDQYVPIMLDTQLHSAETLQQEIDNGVLTELTR